MKGLLVKDFLLLKGQNRFFITVALLAVIFGVVLEQPYFAVGYLPLVFAVFAVSSISYDEYDNGNAFLFTLPITRKMYATEKYLFAFILELLASVVALMFAVLLSFFKEVRLAELLASSAASAAAVMLFLAVLLPVQLKFGGEKGRIIMLLFSGAIAALIMLSSNLLEGLSEKLSPVLEALSKINPAIIVIAFVLLIAAAVALSVKISISILNKKEF